MLNDYNASEFFLCFLKGLSSLDKQIFLKESSY